MTLLVALGYLPLLTELKWQISAFFGLVVAIRLAGIRWRAARVGRAALLVLMLAGIANTLAVYHTPSGQAGGSALFVTMLGLKLLEIRSLRDLRIIGLLVWFLIVIQFLFSQSIALALYLFAISVCTLALQLDLNGALGNHRPHAALRFAFVMTIQAAPLTLVLFLLFPRLDAPLWNLGARPGIGMTGMSDRMELGSIRELVLNGELAFRARFATSPPSESELYWRGPVLWKVDDRGWSRGYKVDFKAGPAELEPLVDPIEYEVLMQPSGQRWLFGLDLVSQKPPESSITHDFQLIADKRITSVKRFRAASIVQYRTGKPTPELRDYALELPTNLSPRVVALAERWRAQAQNDWDVVESALAYFNEEDFHYTLTPAPLGADPTDEFLFETRNGFCEHYASSFAILMRAAGIPSRIVTGYAGGERNPIGGYLMVWQLDAHAWSEVLMPDRGWVRVDPTAAINPLRIDHSGASRLLGSSGSPAYFDIPEGAITSWLRQARWIADSVEMAWRDWVLDFSSATQSSILRALGFERFRTLSLLILLVLSASVVTGLILVALFRESTRKDPIEACFLELCKRLAAVGLIREATEGPSDFADRVIDARPDLEGPIRSFVALYLPARYAGHLGTATERQLRAHLKRLKIRRSNPGA